MPSNDPIIDHIGNGDEQRDIAVPPEFPERTRKGDIGWSGAQPPRPISDPSGPFKNLNGGK